MQKYIKEVFSDYNIENNLIEAKIDNINLYKKTNKLQVKIISNNPININEIESFENYLVGRFKVNKASLDISYGDIKIDESIPENWNNILNYIAKKEPFSKAILTNSMVEVDNQNVNVKLFMKGGSSFLVNQKFDKGLEHLFGNLYNRQYKVQFIEKKQKKEKKN